MAPGAVLALRIVRELLSLSGQYVSCMDNLLCTMQLLVSTGREYYENYMVPIGMTLAQQEK